MQIPKTMYAVIETGGKQYIARPGEIFSVEKLQGEVGSKVQINQVLCVASGDGKLEVGKPTLSGATVNLEIVGQGRGDKIVIRKMKRRKQYRRTQGHRQELTEVLVTGIASSVGNKEIENKAEVLKKFHTALTPFGGFPKAAAATRAVKVAQKVAQKAVK
jgi:large subunit ribosomal protein L21